MLFTEELLEHQQLPLISELNYLMNLQLDI